MSKVEYTVQDGAMWQLHLDVTGAPDTSHPDHPGGYLRPVGVSMGIGQTDGVWSVSAVNVFGQKVKDGKVVTKRNYPLPFLGPLDEDSVAPEWLRDICQEWVDRANGRVKEDFDELLEQSSLGAPHVKEESTPIPEMGLVCARGATEAPTPEALFSLMMSAVRTEEFRRGAEWAIGQIRKEAEGIGDTVTRGFLKGIADGLSERLDMRSAELATRNWRD